MHYRRSALRHCGIGTVMAAVFRRSLGAVVKVRVQFLSDLLRRLLVTFHLLRLGGFCFAVVTRYR